MGLNKYVYIVNRIISFFVFSTAKIRKIPQLYYSIAYLLRDFRNGVMGSSPSGITTQNGGLLILKDFPKFLDERWGNIWGNSFSNKVYH